MSDPLLLVITGTTGSGKNSVGIHVAESLAAEVLSLDSMKVYRGMSIGTAKPSAEDRRRVVHHMIDVLDPGERMDLRRFIDRADAVIAERHAAGVPIVAVGGTAMYLTGLLYGVYEGPPRDEELRRRLRRERDEQGTPALHARLAAVDPESAGRINPNDYQRIERALEVHAATGRAPSELRRGWFETPRYQARVFVMTWPPEARRRRIDDRVEAMFAAGWVDEVARLREAGGLSDEASMALGYREILEHLEGARDEAETRALIKTRTWQFSRRQLTWMKRFEDARVFELGEGDSVESVADSIVADYREWKTSLRGEGRAGS